MAVPAVVKNLTYHLLKYNRKRVGSIAVFLYYNIKTEKGISQQSLS